MFHGRDGHGTALLDEPAVAPNLNDEWRESVLSPLRGFFSVWVSDFPGLKYWAIIESPYRGKPAQPGEVFSQVGPVHTGRFAC